MTDRLTGLDLHKSAVHLQLLIFAYLCTANDKKTSHITLRMGHKTKCNKDGGVVFEGNRLNMWKLHWLVG